MRALCVRVILGSATHYSNPGWVVLCEEWICQCVHLCICVRFLCLFGTQSYLPSIRSQVDMMLQIHQQPRFAVQFQWLIAMQQSTYPIAAFVGEWNQSKCSFSIGHLQCCTWILERMSIQKCNGFWKVLKAMLNFTILLFPPCWVH